jgi:outer membrane protein TolC
MKTTRSAWLALLLLSSTAPPARAAEQVTLQQAVSRALARNPSQEVARAQVARADALLRQVRAAALPQLAGNLNYTRLDEERRRGDLLIAGVDQINMNATVTAPLLAPSRWAAWTRARGEVEVAKAGQREVGRQVAAAAARACLAVILARRSAGVLERARDVARAHLEFARARRSGGVGTRLDEVRAGQEMQANEAQLQTALLQRARAEEALGVLLAADGPVGCAEEQPVKEAKAGAGPGTEGEALAGVTARPDVRERRERVGVLARAVRESFADYLPLLTGVFQTFYQDPPGLLQRSFGWQAQLILSVPLYDGGLRYGLRRERQAQLDDARANLEAALRQARAEVRGAFEAVRRADEALRAAREGAKLAAEALRLAELAYKAGATTNLELLDAERRARDAEAAAEGAADGARQARLDLLIASGRFP